MKSPIGLKNAFSFPATVPSHLPSLVSLKPFMDVFSFSKPSLVRARRPLSVKDFRMMSIQRSGPRSIMKTPGRPIAARPAPYMTVSCMGLGRALKSGTTSSSAQARRPRASPSGFRIDVRTSGSMPSRAWLIRRSGGPTVSSSFLMYSKMSGMPLFARSFTSGAK